jgi:26S proteasome regulatory subunit, ATPase 3, interacting protein
LLAAATSEGSALFEALTPLRAGATALSEEELKALDRDWTKWRGEWVRRRKVFNACVSPALNSGGIVPDAFMRRFWSLATEGLPPQDIEILEEDLGIELDSDEQAALEKSWVCAPKLGRR